MPKAMFAEFCDRYRNLRIPFWFNTRPETMTEEKVRMLEEIGCFRVGIGLEHGNPEFRERMLNRKVSNERIIEACRIIEVDHQLFHQQYHWLSRRDTRAGIRHHSTQPTDKPEFRRHVCIHSVQGDQAL